MSDQRVKTSTFNWKDLVLKAWGPKEWAKPETGYRFSNGREFQSTDRGTSGIYRKPG